MSIVLKIPCVEDRLLDVEVDRNLDMNFIDYDINYDILSESLGEEPTDCFKILLQWERHPLSILFGGCGIPIPQLGIVSCHLTIDAIAQIGLISQFKCLEDAYKLTKACLRTWKAKKPSFDKMYQSAYDVRKCWKDAMSKSRSGLISYDQPTFAQSLVIEASEQCSGFVESFWHAFSYGGYTSVPHNPATIANTCRQAIASTQYDALHLFSPRRSISQWTTMFEDYEMYGACSDELLKILIDVEADQARLVIRVLEKMEQQP